MADLARLTAAIAAGDQHAARRVTEYAIAAGTEPRRIMDAMVAGMAEVGERFKREEAFVPEMLIAARAMKAALELLEPVLVRAGIAPRHTVVIGTVRGDLHDIGKNLVAMMWRGAHLEVVDLGVDVPAERFIEAVRDHDASAVGLSTLLTTTVPSMRDTVAAIRTSECAGVKVIVGGSPVTQDFARRIGADGYAPDAAVAVDALRSLLEP